MRGIELGKARTLEPCHQKKNRPSATLSGTAMVRESLAPALGAFPRLRGIGVDLSHPYLQHARAAAHLIIFFYDRYTVPFLRK